MNNSQLIEFEEKIAEMFNSKQIRAPIHLYNGNEDQIQKVFERIDVDKDWVCCTWRNHYQCLLKGVSEDLLTQKIVAGKSMVINLKNHKVVCSSIVGGIQSIATGIAGSIKRTNSDSRVWCWMGDMSAETGAFHEAYKYAIGFNLPITFIVEDNGLSVTSPTDQVWGENIHWYLPPGFNGDWYESNHLIYYKYKNQKYPHAGAGVRVEF
jgi:pyruvate dehydrogenase E1 component alpha subunit